MVTYTGLRVYEDGSSTLVVKLTEQTPVEFTQDGTKLTFVLGGAKVHLRNNKNPLNAQFFNSNVVRAKLDDTKKGVRVRISLRSDVQPEHKMVSQGSGAVLRIDVPPPA